MSEPQPEVPEREPVDHGFDPDMNTTHAEMREAEPE